MMISPRNKVNFSKIIRCPSQKLPETQKIYIPALSYRRKGIKNHSTGIQFSDRKNKQKKQSVDNSSSSYLAQPHQKMKTINSTASLKVRISPNKLFKSQITKLGKYNNHKSKTSNKDQFCRIVVTDCNQELQHFVEVTDGKSIVQYLKKFYSSVYFKSSPRNILIDYLLVQHRLAASFLNGKNLYLKTCRKTIAGDRISLKHFQIIKPIGSGGFSKVYLCRYKEDGQFYAMKLIDKDFIVKNKKKKIIMNERNIMKRADHPFIIDMKFAFETQKYLAFVLEYCAGGQLFGVIRRYRKVKQDIARFYIIQILLGLGYLHDQYVVYRDIKPENILLTIDGHVKIADLGLAKPNMQPPELAYSFCGSPEYMSPEMILQQGHSFPVDHYCMGALLFELLVGLPPFYSRDPNQIYQAVLTEDLSIPSDVVLTSECQNLLKSLLCKDYKYRLGSIHGIKQILAHPWFGKNDYSKYLRKEITPPENFLAFERLNLQPEIDEKVQKQVDNILKEQEKQRIEVKFKSVMKNFYFDYRCQGDQNKQNVKGSTTRRSSQKAGRKMQIHNRKSLKRLLGEHRTSRN